MKIVAETSHLYGGTILRNDFKARYEEIVDILGSTKLPMRGVKPFTKNKRPNTPKRQQRTVRTVKKYMLLPADLPQLNRDLDDAFVDKLWVHQPVVAPGLPGETRDRSRGDFCKQKVFVEVEFGNTASMFRDLFKFQVANRSRVGEVAVLIVPMRQLARFHDSGIATYEKAEGLHEHLRIGIQMPIWIVGIGPDDYREVKRTYEDMFKVATSNNVKCHELSTVWGTDKDEESVIDEG